jgi:hypothetical protein
MVITLLAGGGSNRGLLWESNQIMFVFYRSRKERGILARFLKKVLKEPELH